jgi:hypothetical protein
MPGVKLSNQQKKDSKMASQLGRAFKAFGEGFAESAKVSWEACQPRPFSPCRGISRFSSLRVNQSGPGRPDSIATRRLSPRSPESPKSSLPIETTWANERDYNRVDTQNARRREMAEAPKEPQNQPSVRSDILLRTVTTETAEFLKFLSEIGCAGFGLSPGWHDRVLTRSPKLGPYLIDGIERNLEVDVDFLRADTLLFTEERGISFPLDTALQHITTPLALACAAGGCRVLVELLRSWVEERKGRVLKIKQGQVELEIHGALTEAQVQEVVAIFTKSLSDNRIKS